MSKESTLVSLAMLKVTIDRYQRDYIDYLRPFVLHALREHSPSPVTDEEVQRLIRQDFGLEIPARVVQLVLQRLARAGALVRSMGVYTPMSRLPDPGLNTRRAEAKRHIDAVINALIEFSQSTPNPLKTDDQALDVLLAFLSEFSIDCLRTYVKGTALPEVARRGAPAVILVSLFVESIARTSPERFASLVVLVEGHMMANALLCPDLASLPKSFAKVLFCLDTPLVVRLLGLEGSPQQQAAAEMIGLVTQLGGRLAVFSHTYDEIDRVIRGAADRIDLPSARGAIVAEMRRQKRSRSDLLLIAEQLEETLRGHRIEVRKTPRYKIPFQIDETAFEGVLADEVQYFNPKARLYDINSVRSIYVLRRGSSPRSLETAQAALVTSNAAFAKAADRYGREIEQSREVSAVITDFSLANIAWLKAPMAAPQLPKKEVLAFCYAAIEPSEGFWSDLLEKAQGLKERGEITPRQLELLRCSPYSRRAAIDLTLGEQEALSGKSVSAILARIEREIREEEDAKLLSEKTMHAQTKDERDRLRTEREHAKSVWYQRCRQVAAAGAILFDFLTIAALLTVPIVTYFQLERQDLVVRVLSPLGVLAVGGVIIGVLLSLSGFSLRGIHVRLRDFLHAQLFRFVLRFVLLEREAKDLPPKEDGETEQRPP